MNTDEEHANKVDTVFFDSNTGITQLFIIYEYYRGLEGAFIIDQICQKIENYKRFVVSGQLSDMFPEANPHDLLIVIRAKYEVDPYVVIRMPTLEIVADPIRLTVVAELTASDHH